MDQKITLRFADHVLTFVLSDFVCREAEMAMRRKWIHRFVRADGDFLVNFDRVLWMKISPGDDVEIEREAVREEIDSLFAPFYAPFSGTVSYGE